MKKGIALLITIGFIAILSAVIAYMFSLSNKVLTTNTKMQQINQSAVLVDDVKTLLDSYAHAAKNDNNLSRFLMGIPPFYDSKNGLSLEVDTIPLSNRININAILINNKVDQNIVKYLQNICATYNVLDSTFFISLVLDTIDTDENARQALSEISVENLKYTNGSIADKREFKVLERYYAEVAQDKNIFNIPWDQFIYFGGHTTGMVDCDRMSKEMLAILGFDSENFAGCSDIKSNESKAIATKYNLKKYTKENNYYILVKIYYQIQSIKDSMSFIYDIKTNKASNFELYE